MLGIRKSLAPYSIFLSLGDFGWVGASQLFTAAARFLILAVMARRLSAPEFGEFAFFVALSLVVANLSELGFGRVLVRFVGIAQGEKDLTSAKRYCGTLLQLKFILSVPILFVGLVATHFARTHHNLSIVRWGVLVGVVSSFAPLVASVFQVQGKFKRYFWAYSIDPVRFVLIAALSLRRQIVMGTVFEIYALSPLLILIALWPSMSIGLKSLTIPAKVSLYSTLWKFGKWLVAITALESLWQRLDVLMLEALSGSNYVAVYSAIYMFMGVAALVSGSVSTLVYPRMAESQGRNAPRELANHYVASMNTIAYFGIPCVLGIAAVGPSLVHTLWGTKYSAGIGLFPAFAIYGIFWVLQSNTGAVFFALGRPSLNFYWILCLVVSSIIGNLILIPLWHAEGAAAVLALSTVLGAVFAWSAIAFCLRVWPDFKRIIILVLCASPMFICVRWVPLPIEGVGQVALRILMGILVYLAALRLMQYCRGLSSTIMATSFDE